MAAARGRARDAGGRVGHARGVVTGADLLAALGRTAVAAATGPQGGIGRGAAQRLARRELSKAMYQPSLRQRVLNAVGSFFARFLNQASASFPGGWWALITVVAVVVLLAAVVVAWVRPARSSQARRPVLAGPVRTAAAYRLAAEQRAAAGDYGAAIVERLRAIAVGLEERGILAPRPGRTADELAAETSAALPGQAEGLSAAARLFDDVRYGGRPGSAAGYERLRDLDAQVMAARPGDRAGPQPAAVASGRVPGPPP
ncbi:MAG: DUF4129 domain-containing protein [Streptosporangiaceae bacterium]